MDVTTAEAAHTEIEAMRAARNELAARETLLTTPEAVRHCPFDVSEETLWGYPEFVLPRIAKNPRAKRATYLYDPRDILALPYVLRQWEKALHAGTEAEFRQERLTELQERDRVALDRILGRAA